MYQDIILNIPHASSVMPVNTWDMTSGNIYRHIERWTDWHTDKMFSSYIDHVTTVVFPVSRFFCDAERLINDPLEEKGQGIYYTRFEDCTRNDDMKEAAMGYYNMHQNLLSSLIKSDDTLLIDCHSFPKDLSDVDVCIGYNEDWSKPSDSLIGQVKAYFEGIGYKVGINNPYSNSLTPASEHRYNSMMIELNKRIYLDDRNNLLPSSYKLSIALMYLYRNILNEWKY